MGILMNAIFLDFLDQDALGLERVNRVLDNKSLKEDLNLRLVRAFVLRPSVDLVHHFIIKVSYRPKGDIS